MPRLPVVPRRSAGDPNPTALRQQRKIATPRRAARGGKRNIARRRMGRKRVFVQRHQVIAVVSALGRVDGEQPGILATMRLGRRTLLELAVERAAKCAGGIVILIADEGVDAATALVGRRARIVGATRFDLDAILPAVADSEAPVVLLHELAFPFAPPPLMTRLALAALDHGGGVAVGPGDVPVGEVSDGLLLPAVGGAHLQHVCMPQAFLRESLVSLHAESGAVAADQVWQQLQRRGELVQAVPNPRFNIRIASSLDWLFARKVIWPWLANRGKPAAARPDMQPGADKPG